MVMTSPIHFVLLVAVTLVAAGCQEALEAPPELSAAFTLYGTLDPTEGRQAIRVIPIRRQIDETGASELDAAVTLVDVAGAQTYVLRDSVVEFSNGRRGHVFHTDFQPDYGRPYRLEIRRSDGALTRAEVVVPQLVDPIPQPHTERGGGIQLPVLFPGAPYLTAVRVTYRVQDTTCRFHTATFERTAAAERFEFGWTVNLPLDTDVRRLFEAAGSNRIALHGVTLTAVVLNREMRPPGGVFDPEVLIEPGVFSNVQGGFGMLAAGYARTVSWVPSGETAQRAGFVPRGTGGC
jgi:hypothetical protein